MKWQRPQHSATPLSLMQPNLIGWVEAAYASDIDEEPQPSRSRKEMLLQQSLEMARGERENERVLEGIVEKAVYAGFYRLAVDAVRAFEPDAHHNYCMALKQVFALRCRKRGMGCSWKVRWWTCARWHWAIWGCSSICAATAPPQFTCGSAPTMPLP
jgi:hypothetical protein